MIQVFATSRCLREFWASFLDSNQLLPKAITISDLEQSSVIVPDRTLADQDTRVLLLKEASDFQNFSKLRIDRDFLAFLKNSEFIFGFFEELAQNGVSLKELSSKDTYAEFSEHLEILEELLSRYKALLDKKKLFDRVNLKELYELNYEYLKSSKGFCLHVEGLLNGFELELFEKIAKVVPFRVVLKVDSYNKKIINSFKEFDLEIGYEYELDLSQKRVLQKDPLTRANPNVAIKAFSSRAMQCAFVQESIASFVNSGIEPSKIVVVTPSEDMAELLREFDRHKNLNFAMGRSFAQTKIYKKIEALDSFLRLQEIENFYRVNRLQIEQNLIDEIRQIWHKKLSVNEVVQILKKLQSDESIYKEELYRFENFLKRVEKLTLKDAFRLFLNRLKSRSLDDVGGGKVTVMGLLESRGVSYEGVIIVDFSDEFVPKRSQKDMFINSYLRESVGLPTTKDRENLQRYFYNSLMSSAKEVAISFVQNEQSMPSRFLDELNLSSKIQKVDEESYFGFMLKSGSKKELFLQESIDSPHVVKVLSASKLATLLRCKRKFYYSYIKNIKEASMPKEGLDSKDFGTLLHKALHRSFLDLNDVSRELVLKRLHKFLNDEVNSIEDRFLVDIWLKKLDKFAQNEERRFKEGYRIFDLERSLHVEFDGFKIEGKIDRIDKKDNKLTIIDYKSGKIKQATKNSLRSESNFQLEFYYLLAKNFGFDIEEVCYYDLNSGELIRESMFSEKLQRLEEILKELKKPINGYEMSEDLKECQYCPYTRLCGREG